MLFSRAAGLRGRKSWPWLSPVGKNQAIENQAVKTFAGWRAEQPADVYQAIAAESDPPGKPSEPGELRGGSPHITASGGQSKAADPKHDPMGIGKGVFVAALHADPFIRVGDAWRQDRQRIDFSISGAAGRRFLLPPGCRSLTGREPPRACLNRRRALWPADMCLISGAVLIRNRRKQSSPAPPRGCRAWRSRHRASWGGRRGSIRSRSGPCASER